MARAKKLKPLTHSEKLELIALLEERERREKYTFFDQLFPPNSPLSIDNYPKHKEFFRLTGTHKEVLMLAGNRLGKTIAGGFALTCHLTGKYPEWWEGRRYDRPSCCLAAGDTLDTTKDIIQKKLLGGSPDGDDWGSGIVPREYLGTFNRWSGKTGLISEVKVKHISGGWSTLKLRSYDQGRKTFQGTELDVVWLDEEVPQDVYEEALVRTMTTQGQVMLTFTPLSGLTPLVMTFLPGGDLVTAQENKGAKAVVMATWDDAPHLSKEDKDALYEALPPHQRDARSKGIPALGSGAIYPVAEDEFKVAPFEIPAWWKRCYALDVGWNRTACIWGALDTDTDILYLYSEHYRSQAEPAIHAAAIQARGKWLNGVIDPASRGRSQSDGKQLFQQYLDLGLHISPSKNGVESGIYEVWQRLSTGRLKVFSTLNNFFSEYRIYRRDDKGRIVKDSDHLMDVTRYLILSGLDVATNSPVKKTELTYQTRTIGDAITGY